LAHRDAVTGGGVHPIAKNLSVNNVHLQRDLAEGDDGRGQMVERDEAGFELFVAVGGGLKARFSGGDDALFGGRGRA
jgi:hypothetical protein